MSCVTNKNKPRPKKKLHRKQMEVNSITRGVKYSENENDIKTLISNSYKKLTSPTYQEKSIKFQMKLRNTPVI